MLKKIWKGFSWVEIGSALLLFVIIVALTLPSLSRFKCLAKQSEAKFEVKRIVAAAELYKSEHGRYPNIQELIDTGRVTLKLDQYDYEVKAAENGTKVQVLAIGKVNSQVQDDVWRAEGNKKLENLHDACAK
jgi:competence protein ComGC